MVPGHEVAGVVSKVGDKVTKFKVGDNVGIGCYVDTCRECTNCRTALDNYCDKMVTTYNTPTADGTPTYGGYSKCMVVDENYVLRMPKSVPLDAAAPLLCAGITTYSPLKHWKAGPGKKVGVIGLGGVGHMAVKLAHAMGAEVHVFSHSDKKKADATRMGAHYFHSTSANPEIFKQYVNTFDLILNSVSSALDWDPYIGMLKLDGAIVALGLPEKGDLTIKMGPLVFKRRTVSGSLIGSIAETQEMLDFCDLHKIGCDVEVISIDKVNEAYERVLKSDVRYRFVIDMNTL